MNKLKVIGMIPARLQSSRLPEKPLLNIEGLPMVVHTCKRAQMASILDEVYLVTDSKRIKKVAQNYNIKTIMTGKHKTGSDRVAKACEDIDCDIVVSIHGDEPLVNPDNINNITAVLINNFDNKEMNMTVGVTPFYKQDSQSDIKAVLDLQGNILYCSRTDIPNFSRTGYDGLPMLKMAYVVPFRKEFLLQYSKWESTPLELIEFNEHLRILEHGYKIRAVHVPDAKISVDTPECLKEIRRLMKKDKLLKLYK